MASFVLGMMGKKRSGKDTFAVRLIEQHGFTKVSLADPLREMLKALDPIVDCGNGYGALESVWLTDVLGDEDDWEVAKELPEVRRLMQRIGTEAGRNVLGDDIWTNAAQRTIRDIDGPVVITDVRFPNEFNLVEEILDGWTVRITRPSLPVGVDLHPSETALDDTYPRYEIINDGTVADLHNAADLLVRDARAAWKLGDTF